MAELPEPLQPTVAAIDKAVEASAFRSTPWRVSASMLAYECERRAWYALHWSHEPEQHAGQKLRLFETGRAEEARLLGYLAAVPGVRVSDIDASTGKQHEYTGMNGHLRVKLDAIAWGILEAPKTAHLVECKTHSAKSFGQLRKHGLAVAKPDHVAQMQVGMALAGLTRAFYLAKNKDDDALHSERVHADAGHAAALLAKAERILGDEAPPERISADPQFWQCRGCASAPVCHGGHFAPRNCRTCLHSSPGATGPDWHCARHRVDMTPRQQQDGCPHHLYRPGLVPGEQIDADAGAETVTYRMPDGAVWVDGNQEAQGENL